MFNKINLHGIRFVVLTYNTAIPKAYKVLLAITLSTVFTRVKYHNQLMISREHFVVEKKQSNIWILVAKKKVNSRRYHNHDEILMP